MAKVMATEKGFFGGIVREIGAVFVVPDEVWNDAKRRPKWCVPAAFGGKGDHDGDGKPGGSKPVKAPAGDDDKKSGKAVTVPADWQNLSAKDRKALAEAITGEKPANVKDADTVIAAYIEGQREPFDDAPEPQTVALAQKAVGGAQPDWVAPTEAPKAVDA